MGQRGRRSTADLNVVPVLPGARRPDAPPHLSEAEAGIWRATVTAMPASWFVGAESVLARYCAVTAGSEEMEHRIRAMWATKAPIDRTLLAAHARATSTLIKLARALRLSPASRTTTRTAAGRLSEAKSTHARPWEIRARNGSGDDPPPDPAAA